MAEILVEEHPGVGEEMAKIKHEKAVLRQFERRLGRVLDGQETSAQSHVRPTSLRKRRA